MTREDLPTFGLPTMETLILRLARKWSKETPVFSIAIELLRYFFGFTSESSSKSLLSSGLPLARSKSLTH